MNSQNRAVESSRSFGKGTSVRFLIVVLLVLAAAAVSVWVPLWCHWPFSAGQSLDQVDAAVLPERLVQGLTATLSAFPSFALRVEFWKNIGLYLAWLGAVMGWGGLGRRWILTHLTCEECTVIRFALGTLWLGLALECAGLAGWFRGETLAFLLVLGWAFLLLDARFVFPPRLRISARRPNSFAYTLCWFFIVSYLVLGFLYALTPPIQSDGMRYHLAAVQEYLRHRRVIYLPHNAFSNFPFLVEMHFAFGVAANVPEHSQLVHYTYFLAVGGLLHVFARRLIRTHAPRWSRSLSGHLTAWLPAWLYWTVPANTIVAAWPFVDQAVNFYWLAAFFVAYLALERKALRSFALLGCLLGAALGAKYTSLALVVFLLIVMMGLAAWPSSSLSFRHVFRGLLVALILTGVTSVLWFAKNYAFTGNPLYPLAGSLFGYGEFSPRDAALYAQKMAEKGVPKTAMSFFLSPLFATFRWTAFEHHFLGAHLLVGFLLALVSSLLCRSPKVRLWTMAAFLLGGLLYALWFFTYQSNRMLGAVLGLWFLTACFGQAHLSHRKLVGKAAMAACWLTGLFGALYNVQYVTSIHRPPLYAYFSGRITRDEYLADALNYYRAFKWLESRVHPDEKVLLIGEHRIFYAPFNAVWSDWFDTPAILAIIRNEKPHDVPDLIAALRQCGVEWILVNEAELLPQRERYWKPRFTPEEWQLYEKFVSLPHWDRVRIPPGVTIFRISPRVESAG